MSGFGIDFKNNAGAKMLDGAHIVPQLFQKRSMLDPYYAANYAPGYVEYDEGSGAPPGYTIRSYYGGESPTDRPHIILVSCPNDGSNTWIGPGVYTIAFPTGQPPANHPDIYYFTLDTVTASSTGYGMRVFKADGTTLTYDSGNKHLNIHAIMDNVSVDDYPGSQFTDEPGGYMRSFSIPSGVNFPAKPAIMLPSVQCGRYWHIRFSMTYEYQAHSFYRVYNNQLQTMMMRTYYEEGGFEDDSSPSYNHAYPQRAANDHTGTKTPTIVIDASIYD